MGTSLTDQLFAPKGEDSVKSDSADKTTIKEGGMSALLFDQTVPLNPESEGLGPRPTIQEPKPVDSNAVRRYYSNKALYPIPFVGTAKMGLQAGMTPEGGFDELGRALDASGRPYAEEPKESKIVKDMAHTMKGLSSLAKQPMEVVRGAAHLALSLPGAGIGMAGALLRGGGEAIRQLSTLRPSFKYIAEGDINLERIHDAMSKGMEEGTQFFEPGIQRLIGAPTKESMMVGEIAMAPMNATVHLGQSVARAEMFKDSPNIRGAARMLGDIAGFAAMGALLHGPSRKAELAKEVESVVTEAADIKAKVDKVMQSGDMDTVAKNVELQALEVQRQRLENKAAGYAKKLGDDMLLVEESARLAEEVAKEHARPVDISRPEMAEGYEPKPVKMTKKAQAKLDREIAKEKAIKEGKVTELKQPEERPLPFKPGDTVRIKEGALGRAINNEESFNILRSFGVGEKKISDAQMKSIHKKVQGYVETNYGKDALALYNSRRLSEIDWHKANKIDPNAIAELIALDRVISKYGRPTEVSVKEKGTVVQLRKKAKEEPTAPATVESLQKQVDSSPELAGKIRIDALGEEGTTVPPGYAQVTVLEEGRQTTFASKADIAGIVDKYKSKMKEYDEAAKRTESVKKFNELEEEGLTPQQMRVLDRIVEELEGVGEEVARPVREQRRTLIREEKKAVDEKIDYFGEKERAKPEAVNEVDKSTGNDIPSGVRDNIFMKSAEDTKRLHEIFAEREKSVREDPDLYVQKLVNDVRRWVYNEDVDIAGVRKLLSEMASRSDEMRQFFDTGADHIQFMEIAKEAAKWARNARRGGSGGTSFNVMLPLDKIPDTVRLALKYLFPGKTKLSVSDVVRNKELFDSTGFWLGRDNKWRYELDPKDIRYHIPIVAKETFQKAGQWVDVLTNVISSDKLFNTFPGLRKVMVVWDEALSQPGAYHRGNKIIKLKGMDLKVLEHELQHAINAEAGSKFLGTNTEVATAKSVIRTLGYLYDLEKDPVARENISKVMESIAKQNSVKVSDLTEIKSSIKTLWDGVGDFISHMKERGIEVYKKDPGEMESRLVQRRFDMTKEQRKVELPWETLDKMLAEEGVARNIGNRLYSGDPAIEAVSRAVVEGAKKVAEYTKMARGMKKFKLGAAAARVREEFVRSVIDRSGNIKADMLETLGQDGYRIVQKMVLAKGASARAVKELKQMRAEVYEGLSTREKKILDDIILDDRMIDIAKYKSPGEFKFPQGMTPRDFIAHRMLYGEIEKLSPAQVEKLNRRAEAYFEWMKKPLDDMLDAGLISRTEYSDLVSHNYRRIKLVDIFDKRYSTKIGNRVRTVYDSGVEALARGRETDIYEPSSEVMALEVFNRAYGRIYNNQANLALLELAKSNPENPFAMIKSKEHPDVKIPSGWHRIQVFDNGEKRSVWISPEMGKEWIINSPEISYKMGQVLRWASGSPVLRTFATGINWGFALANVPRDIMHAWFTARRFENGQWKSVYSPNAPLFSAQMGRDLSSVFTDAMRRKGKYNDYINEGGGMEFLVHQGRLLQRGRHIDSKIGDVLDFMGYFGETGEILTRLAIRDRVIRQEAKKRGISYEEAYKDKELTREATFVARDYMDFGQGGGISKAVDNALPYLNASIQGTRGMFRAFRPGAGTALSSTYKLGQLGSVIVGTYIASKMLAPNTMKALKGDRNTVNNLVIPLGDQFSFVDDEGQTRYIYMKIPMDPGQKFFKTLFEGATDKWLGDEINVDRITDTLTELSPVGTSQLPPTVSGALGYVGNKDFWLNEDIWTRTEKPFSWPESSQEFTRKTPQLYTDIGKVTGLSPERTKFAVEELITNGTIWSYMLNQGYDAAFGDLPKERKEQHLAMTLARLPGFKRFIGVTNPYSKHVESIDKADEEATLKRFVENRGMDVLVDGHLYGNVSRQEVIDYARSFKDTDTYDRLIERFEWEQAIRDIPEKSFWRRMKGLANEAKARVFVDRLNSSSPEEQKALWREFGTISAAGDVISDETIELISKLRSQQKVD